MKVGINLEKLEKLYLSLIKAGNDFISYDEDIPKIEPEPYETKEDLIRHILWADPTITEKLNEDNFDLYRLLSESGNQKWVKELTWGSEELVAEINQLHKELNKTGNFQDEIDEMEERYDLEDNDEQDFENCETERTLEHTVINGEDIFYSILWHGGDWQNPQYTVMFVTDQIIYFRLIREFSMMSRENYLTTLKRLMNEHSDNPNVVVQAMLYPSDYDDLFTETELKWLKEAKESSFFIERLKPLLPTYVDELHKELEKHNAK